MNKLVWVKTKDEYVQKLPRNNIFVATNSFVGIKKLWYWKLNKEFLDKLRNNLVKDYVD